MDELEFRVKDRVFLVEAVEVESVDGTYTTFRVFESGALLNADYLPQLKNAEEAIQAGFEWCRKL